MRVQFSRPGCQSFTGVLLGCSPVALGVLFVRRDDTGETVACDGEYLTAVARILTEQA